MLSAATSRLEAGGLARGGKAARETETDTRTDLGGGLEAA
jgi:hypothetical protein